MKIFIIGPSCVGKTRLSAILSQKMKIRKIDLDLCFNDIEGFKETGKFGYLSPKKGVANLMKQIKDEKNWIVEGVFPVKELFEKADVVAYMKFSILVSCLFQWIRYATDIFQRNTYGFRSNLFFLTPDIYRQYYSRKYYDIDDPRQFSVKKYEKMLPKYKKKLHVILNKTELDDFLATFIVK